MKIEITFEGSKLNLTISGSEDIDYFQGIEIGQQFKFPAEYQDQDNRLKGTFVLISRIGGVHELDLKGNKLHVKKL